jgi:long-chain acyl-CoA synthetase
MARLSASLAASRGDDIAIVDDDSSLTWRAFDERVNRCLDGLRRRGHHQGATVAVLCGNRHQFLEVTIALFHGGYLFPPINWHFSPIEAAHIIDDSGATALVVDDRYLDVALQAITLSGRPTTDRGVSYEQLLADGSPNEPAEQSLGAVMMYTSGTTGRPKGVRSTGMPLGGEIELGELATHGYLSLFGIEPAGRSLITAPLYHGGPYIFGAVPFAAGCSIVLRRTFDPVAVLRDIDEFGITNAYFVPTHFARLLRLPEQVKSQFSGASLRTVWHTAAPCPPEIKRAMIEWWGPVLHETYAASDAGVGTLISSAEWLAKPGSVGRPSPFSEILIIDDDGHELPAGETGTIYIRNRLGGDVSYHNDPAKTAAAHLAPGVVTAGDIGYLDADGYLYLSDRKIDMIISGGVNIYPAEIEAVLLQHPAVRDAAVVGVPNAEWGEEVKGVVERLDDGPAEADLEASLLGFCREHLARFKCPQSIDIVDKLPRSDNGKLYKRRLRESYRGTIDA